MTCDGAVGMRARRIVVPWMIGCTWAHRYGAPAEELPCRQPQRSVWHQWRNLNRPPARALKQASAGLDQETAKDKRQDVRQELGKLMHMVIDAAGWVQAESGLQTLGQHPFGLGMAQFLNVQLDLILI